MKYPNDTAQAYLRRCEMAHSIFQGIIAYYMMGVDAAEYSGSKTGRWYTVNGQPATEEQYDGNTKQDTTNKGQTRESDPT